MLPLALLLAVSAPSEIEDHAVNTTTVGSRHGGGTGPTPGLSHSRRPMARSYLAGWLLAAAVLTSSCYLGVCRGRLDDVGYACPKRFEGTLAGLPQCRPVDYSGGPRFFISDYDSEIRICKDLIKLSSGGRLGGSGCYYDGESHQLVGAYHFGDTPTYCGRSSLGQSAGRAPAADACPRDPTYIRECPAR
jgi:hypothetical protein